MCEGQVIQARKFSLIDSRFTKWLIIHHWRVADILDTIQKFSWNCQQWHQKEQLYLRLKGLQVRGLFSSKKITVPTVYTREFIPANWTHPNAWNTEQNTLSTNGMWDWSAHWAKLPTSSDAREVVCGEEIQTFAQKKQFGLEHSQLWRSMWERRWCNCHLIIVQQVIPSSKPSVKLKDEVPFDP